MFHARRVGLPITRFSLAVQDLVLSHAGRRNGQQPGQCGQPVCCRAHESGDASHREVCLVLGISDADDSHGDAVAGISRGLASVVELCVHDDTATDYGAETPGQ